MGAVKVKAKVLEDIVKIYFQNVSPKAVPQTPMD
jgi:hypothetical protein